MTRQSYERFMQNTVVKNHSNDLDVSGSFMATFSEPLTHCEYIRFVSFRFAAESPATFETPTRDTPFSSFSTPSTTSKKRKNSDTISIGSANTEKAPSDGHSLDSFLSAYTSEDNCSFQELIETADKRLRQKFSVLFDAEINTAIAVAQSLCLPSIEDQFKTICGSKIVDTWTYTNKNSIMYVPDGAELTKEEKLDLVNKRQEIEYGNTRLKNNPFDEQRSKETITEAAKMQVCISIRSNA